MKKYTNIHTITQKTYKNFKTVVKYMKKYTKKLKYFITWHKTKNSKKNIIQDQDHDWDQEHDKKSISVNTKETYKFSKNCSKIHDIQNDHLK